MNIAEILVRSPVNRQAYLATSQKHVTEIEKDISDADLCELFNRLCKRQKELKLVLNITTKAQHWNAVDAFKKGHLNLRQVKSPLQFTEYIRNGDAIQLLQQELHIRKEARRFVAKQLMESAC